MKTLSICSCVLLGYAIFLVIIMKVALLSYGISLVHDLVLSILLGLFLVLIYISERVYRSEKQKHT